MLHIYNTLTNKKELFKPLQKGKVGIYTCGPTVYGYIHIGNIRSYLTADIIRRYLEYLGFEVRHIKNITDVGHLTNDDIAQGDSGEDKLIKKSKEEEKSPKEIARFYEEYFKEKEKEMNIIPAQYFPRATAHVSQMIKIIGDLIAKEYAYEKNGNVFFDIKKFKDYGKLSGNTLENLKIGARLEEHPDKKNPWDFALWLKAPKEHLMKWDSPWGTGYPGWHIECSAMSTEYLGATMDIHTGGEDNIFPHHEAEIAQTECWTGKKFANYWVHTRHLLVEGEKMSKSKGNLYTLEDIKEKSFSAMDLRLLLLSSHYRSQLNFSWQALRQAQKNMEKISQFVMTLKNTSKNSTQQTVISKSNFQKIITGILEKFEKAMNDDLNTPLAFSILYELISEINKKISTNELSKAQVKEVLSLWGKMNKVFGLQIVTKEKGTIPKTILKLAEERKLARKNKDFQEADSLRKKIEARGFLILDTEKGYSISKKINNFKKHH